MNAIAVVVAIVWVLRAFGEIVFDRIDVACGGFVGVIEDGNVKVKYEEW